MIGQMSLGIWLDRCDKYARKPNRQRQPVFEFEILTPSAGGRESRIVLLIGNPGKSTAWEGYLCFPLPQASSVRGSIDGPLD